MKCGLRSDELVADSSGSEAEAIRKQTWAVQLTRVEPDSYKSPGLHFDLKDSRLIIFYLMSQFTV